MALQHDTVHGHLAARLDAKRIANHDRVERDRFVPPFGTDTERDIGGEPQQALDCGVGARARAHFQYLPEQHQRDDHCGRLEIQRQSVSREECSGQTPGPQQHVEAEDIGRRHAERDQAEHVQLPGDERAPSQHEERAASPHDDDRGQQRLEALGHAHCCTEWPTKFTERAVDPGRQVDRQDIAHRHEQQWKRGDGRKPQASRHRAQLGVGVLARALRNEDLETHATNGTVTGLALTQERMHGTGVDRRRYGLRGRQRRRRRRSCSNGRGHGIHLRSGHDNHLCATYEHGLVQEGRPPVLPALARIAVVPRSGRFTRVFPCVHPWH